MKKLISISAGVLLVFSMWANFAIAAPTPVIINPIIALDCTIAGTCAVYVNDDTYIGVQNGTKDYWFMSIDAAVSFVKGDADYNTIIIADGTYSPSTTSETLEWTFDSGDTWGSSKGIYIYGGYDSDWVRDVDANETIIDGEDTVSGAFSITDLKGKISGIQFTGMAGSFPAPIKINNSTGTSYNVVVESNEFYGNSGALGTTGVTATASGSNSVDIYSNIFRDNSAANASVISMSGDVDFYSNVVMNNDNDIYGSVYCIDGGALYNNYFLNNDGNYRIINLSGDCEAYNNSIVDNTVDNDSTYAVVSMANDNNVLANNLITHNAGEQPWVHISGDTSTVEYNALFNDNDPSSLTDGNVLCDPLYAGVVYNDPDDVKLGEGSECIDKGKDVGSMVSHDYYGTSRPLDGDDAGGAQYDPGAYEAPAVVAPATTAPTISGLGASPSTFSPDADGTDDSTEVTFDIDQNADVTVTVLDASDVEVVKLSDNLAMSAGSVSVDWDGKNASSDVVEDGTYKVKVDASNAGGDDTATVNVEVDNSEEPEPSEEGCGGYSDVPASHSDCDAIEYVQSIGAMTGNPDGTFEPMAYLQRDQVAKISLETYSLFNDSSDYCQGNDPFPDVPVAQWSYQYICRGVDLGMITGYLEGDDAGFYRPSRSVNRVEFLALILRNNSDTMPSTSSSSYDDVESGQWYSGYAKYSYDNSLFEGNDLKPTMFTKRVEVARVIYKLDQLGKL